MSAITKEQHQMLFQYDQLLTTISEGLDYLEKNLTEEAPPQAQQVFEDLLHALEQISQSHEQMKVMFDDEEALKLMLEDFYDIVKMLQEWFQLHSNTEKRELLASKVIPAYEAWRTQIQQFVKPFITH